MPTYAAPGVYVEEVVSTQKVLTAAPTAVAAFVGFTERCADRRPADPEGLAPRLVTSWTQFESLYGGFTPGRDAAAVGLRLLRQRRRAGLHRPGTEHRAVRRAVRAASCRPPTARSACRAGREPRAGRRHHHPDQHRRRPTRTGPAPFTLDVLSRTAVGRVVRRPDPRQRQAQRRDRRQRDVDQDQGRRPARREDRPVRPARGPQAGGLPAREGRADSRFRSPAGSSPARSRPASGINGLAIADDVTMVVVPDLVTAATKEDGTARPRPLEGRADRADQPLRAERQPDGRARRAARHDPAADQGMAQRRRDVRLGVRRAVLPVDQGREPDRRSTATPRCSSRRAGHIAGVWARTDETRGVWKAPANDTIRGCLDVEYGVTQNEQALLNPIGINCIRPFGTRGIRIWGARTLSSDTDWRYINVRRLFNMIETTILDGTQWAVFEPNDMALWEGVKRTLNAFLRGLWTCRRAVRRNRVDQAFYVKCDAETNPPESIDQGTAHRRGRHRAGQAGRVRRVPHRPAEADRQLTRRAIPDRRRTPEEHIMPNDLINTDPIVSQNFFLEIDGSVVSILSSVSGLDIEMEVVDDRTGRRQRQGPGGQDPRQGATRHPTCSLVRMAPPDTTQDKLWGWFNDIRDKGILLSRPLEQPQERLDRDVRLDQRRGRPVQLHQRLAVARSPPTSCRSTRTTRSRRPSPSRSRASARVK